VEEWRQSFWLRSATGRPPSCRPAGQQTEGESGHVCAKGSGVSITRSGVKQAVNILGEPRQRQHPQWQGKHPEAAAKKEQREEIEQAHFDGDLGQGNGDETKARGDCPGGADQGDTRRVGLEKPSRQCREPDSTEEVLDGGAEQVEIEGVAEQVRPSCGGPAGRWCPTETAAVVLQP
jgi:hypothetical protein